AALDPTGREVFVGHLPRGMYEDQLYELFSSVGNVCDVRVMVDPNTGCGRGFGFVCYANKEDAAAAVEKFNGYEAATRRHLQVNITNPNLRLFVGNVPKTKSREELLADFQSHLDGVVDVIVTAPTGPNGGGGVPGVPRKNRGFCFVEFKKHSAASAARRRLQRQPRVWPAAADVWVDWADPLEEPDPAALETVRAVYVRGISPSVTEQQLAEAFAGADCGQPERVRLVQSEYAFVHFANRDAAVRAVEAMNGTELAGSQLSVSMARPVSERAKQRKEERRMARYQQMMPVQHHGPPHHPPHGHFAQHHQHPMPPPPPPPPHHHHHHQAHQPPPLPPPPPPQPQYVPAPMPQQPQVQ
uniref:RRM domain-containing protein n=2 Tax=Macrostomum lignano TaxID=282301 RepID=A0A1I8JLW5_9PLAT